MEKFSEKGVVSKWENFMEYYRVIYNPILQHRKILKL